MATVNRHDVLDQPLRSGRSGQFRKAAEQDAKLDTETARQVRTFPTDTTHRSVALADLARGERELQAVGSAIRNDPDGRRGAMIRLLDASGGCFVVHTRPPIGG